LSKIPTIKAKAINKKRNLKIKKEYITVRSIEDFKILNVKYKAFLKKKRVILRITKEKISISST